MMKPIYIYIRKRRANRVRVVYYAVIYYHLHTPVLVLILFCREVTLLHPVEIGVMGVMMKLLLFLERREQSQRLVIVEEEEGMETMTVTAYATKLVLCWSCM